MTFADTSFFVAAVSPRDNKHAAAVSLTKQLRAPILTTEFVLVEVGNWLASSGDRAVFVQLARDLDADVTTTIVPATRDLFVAGLDLYAARLDKGWSLTDCISFVVMQQYKVTEALTADHHFAQAGFVALMR